MPGTPRAGPLDELPVAVAHVRPPGAARSTTTEAADLVFDPLGAHGIAQALLGNAETDTTQIP